MLGCQKGLFCDSFSGLASCLVQFDLFQRLNTGSMETDTVRMSLSLTTVLAGFIIYEQFLINHGLNTNQFTLPLSLIWLGRKRLNTVIRTSLADEIDSRSKNTQGRHWYCSRHRESASSNLSFALDWHAWIWGRTRKFALEATRQELSVFNQTSC